MLSVICFNGFLIVFVECSWMFVWLEDGLMFFEELFLFVFKGVVDEVVYE